MSTEIQKAIIAGICFAAWPMFMNRTGLEGVTSSSIVSLAVLLAILPLTLYVNGLVIPQANWWMVIMACILAALGMYVFTSMISQATVKNIGLLFICMTIVQIAVASIYQTIMTGNLSWDKGCGYTLAVLAAYLLLK